MNPQDVNPNNFTQERIIYNNNDFSIAIGIWNDDDSRRFAMRWNGNNDTAQLSLGYPNIFGNPMWFQLPEDITDILKVLAENNI